MSVLIKFKLKTSQSKYFNNNLFNYNYSITTEYINYCIIISKLKLSYL